MLSAAIGKRYERLLFFTAPVSLACILVFLVAFASTSQKDRVDASCYSQAAEVFLNAKAKLDEDWKKAQPIEKNELLAISYKYSLSLAWINADQSEACYKFIDEKIHNLHKKSPEDIAKEFQANAMALMEKPLKLYGVELPSDTTLEFSGNKVQIELLTLTRIMQIVLLPVLLMWLGSLYSTRFREALLISRANTIAEVFPHVINMYPAGSLPSPKKKDFLAPYAKQIACFIYGITRLSLLSIFILPPVVSYVASLYLISTEDFFVLFLVSGVVVSMFAFTTLIAEFLPNHYWKVFPDLVLNE